MGRGLSRPVERCRMTRTEAFIRVHRQECPRYLREMDLGYDGASDFAAAGESEPRGGEAFL
jgi:hypothetical protein